MKGLAPVSTLVVLLATSSATTVLANPITSAEDKVETRVTTDSSNSHQFNIRGGTQTGANLFHSFKKFGLSQGQIANFNSDPSIRNILGRVVGGMLLALTVGSKSLAAIPISF